jgi:hypothetical protein
MVANGSFQQLVTLHTIFQDRELDENLDLGSKQG